MAHIEIWMLYTGNNTKTPIALSHNRGFVVFSISPLTRMSERYLFCLRVLFVQYGECMFRSCSAHHN